MDIKAIMESLKIADALTIGEILQAKGLYSNVQSGRVNAQKKLNDLADLKQIEKCDGYYRVLDCKSEYKDHSKLLTKILAEVIKLNDAVILREPTIIEMGLRPDAIILLTKDGKGLCIVLEVLINETEAYFTQKVNTWNNWPGSLGYLANLLSYKIPHFEIIPVTEITDFRSYLEGVL
jgi:hypothetical protein